MRARRGRGLGRGRPARGRAQAAREEEPGAGAPPASLPEPTPDPDRKAGWAGGDYLQPAATLKRLYELGDPEGQIIEAVSRPRGGASRIRALHPRSHLRGHEHGDDGRGAPVRCRGSLDPGLAERAGQRYADPPVHLASWEVQAQPTGDLARALLVLEAA